MSKLKIAIQKSGRLYDDSVKLLKDCGIGLKDGVNKLKTECDNFPMEIYFLRDDDIPQYVEDAVADIGIVGENVVYEKNKKVDLVERLGFGKCRLSVAVGRGEPYEGVGWLEGRRIATTYPLLVRQFLDKHQIGAEIHEISGSVRDCARHRAGRCDRGPGQQREHVIYEWIERGGDGAAVAGGPHPS